MAWPNGLYLATGFLDDRILTAQVRVDLEGVAVGDGRVSLDLFEGFASQSVALDTDEMTATYLASFRSTPIPRTQPAAPNDLTVLLQGLPPESGTALLHLRPSPSGEGGQLDLETVDASPVLLFGKVSFTARFKHGRYRDLTLEVDMADGKPHPADVRLTTQFPAATLATCFARAGFRLLEAGGSSLLETKPEWTLDQLAGVAATKPATPAGEGFFLRQQGWSLTAYQMIVSRLADDASGTLGAMFDRPHRAASAVFYDALVDNFGRAVNGPDELGANFLLTAVHEVAHSLNLPHVFEDARLAGLSAGTLSFMNYPHRYEGAFSTEGRKPFRGATGWTQGDSNRYQNFWSVFDFNFDPRELLELRHGARRDILIGGSDDEQGDPVTPYRGAFTGTTTTLAVGGPNGVGLELGLRVRGVDRSDGLPARPGRPAERRITLFDFGQPVHVEAELRSLLARPQEIDCRLSVLTGDLRIFYEDPDGRFHAYEPPAVLCVLPRPQMLDGTSGADAPAAFHKDVCLSFGGRGFEFLTPGRYRIRAAYRHRGTLLLSNVLTVYVRRPDRKTEDALVPLLDDDVATYFAFRGVPGLAAAQDRLGEVFRDDGGRLRDNGHPLFHYYCAYEGRLRQTQAAGSVAATAAYPAHAEEDAGECYKAAFEVTNPATPPAPRKLAALPFSNVELAKFGAAFADVVQAGDGAANANRVRSQFRKALDIRSVPDAVRPATLRPPPARRRRTE